MEQFNQASEDFTPIDKTDIYEDWTEEDWKHAAGKVVVSSLELETDKETFLGIVDSIEEFEEKYERYFSPGPKFKALVFFQVPQPGFLKQIRELALNDPSVS